MTKWLVTWEWAGDHAKVDGKVAAILDSRIGSERVRQTVELLYVNARYSLGERLAYAAKKFNPYPAEYGILGGVRWSGQLPAAIIRGSEHDWLTTSKSNAVQTDRNRSLGQNASSRRSNLEHSFTVQLV